MINMEAWVNTFMEALDQVFGDRIWFVGLQGSRGRGEATETSDIDMVVILDELSQADIQAYHDMLDTLEHRELMCGFLSGKDELFAWNPSDLFQLCHDTTPLRGSLEAVMQLIDDKAIDRAIHLGACNLFHGCVHNRLYGKSLDTLYGLYKGASFVVQAIAYREKGYYTRHIKDLLTVVSGEERAVLETFLTFKNGGEVDFQAATGLLFDWTKKWINALG